MTIARRMAALLLALTAALLPAAPAVAETVLVRAAHMIDPASGTVRDDVAVLVVDGRVTQVGTGATPPPAGATVIDLGKAWLMPGLIDTHSHLAVATIADEMHDASDGALALTAYRNGREMLWGGFTTVRDLGQEGGFAVVDLRRQIEAGLLDGPTILSAGKVIAPYGGDRDRVHPLPLHAGAAWDRNYVDADTPEEALKAVRHNIRYGAKVIKLYLDIHPYHMAQADIAAAVAEAHRAGLKVAAHVAGGPAADAAIAAGVDSIEHGFMLSEAQLRAMKARGIYLSGTDFDPHSLGIILRDDTKVARFAPLIRNRLAMAHRIGVPLAFGSDAVWPDAGRPRAQIVLDETKTWIDAGVPPMTLLKAMTGNAAELLGVAADRGAIRPGLFADLVAMPANPLDDVAALRDICFVMKQGRVVRACDGAGPR